MERIRRHGLERRVHGIRKREREFKAIRKKVLVKRRWKRRIKLIQKIIFWSREVER